MSTLQNQPVAASPHARMGHWTTPRRLRAARAAILGLTVAFAGAIWVGIGAHREAMRTVGVDTAPSIIAAQGMKAEIASMDANLANELLGAAGSASGLNNYDAARGRAESLLLEAAENITFGEAEAGPLRTLQNGLGAYENFSQAARDAHAAAGGDETEALNAYRQAAALTDRSLLPAAEDLDAANLRELDRTYKKHVEESAGSTGLVVLMGVLTLAALVALQVFLSRRMRRTVNPALLVATVLVLWLTIHAAHAMTEAQKQLRVARKDAFASVHALLRARAAAFEADSFESRYLLDTKNADAAVAGFQSRDVELARFPEGVTPEDLIQQEAAGRTPADFTGYIADELKNITFPGEREAALHMLVTWERYYDVDTRIRELVRKNQRPEAIALATSTQPGGADRAFDDFDKALDQTVAINQRVFDASVKQGFAALDGVETQALVVAAIVAALVFAGLLGRLREYA